MKFVDSETALLNKDIKEHTKKVINALTDMIEIICKPTENKSKLYELGNIHFNNLIPVELFPMMGNAINTSILSALKEDCTIEILNTFTLF